MPKERTIPTVAEAFNRLAARCATSEQAPSDLLRKMTEWGMEPQAAAAVMERLTEEHYVNEARYARAYTHDKLHYARWGRVKIRLSLRQKGLDGAAIEEALHEVDETAYRRTLHELLASQNRGIKARSAYERRAKLLRFAAQRGFEPALAMRLLDELGLSGDED